MNVFDLVASDQSKLLKLLGWSLKQVVTASESVRAKKARQSVRSCCESENVFRFHSRQKFLSAYLSLVAVSSSGQKPWHVLTEMNSQKSFETI